jgi:hypothetical protein
VQEEHETLRGKAHHALGVFRDVFFGVAFLLENGGQLFAERAPRKHWSRARLVLGANMEHEPRPRVQVT